MKAEISSFSFDNLRLMVAFSFTPGAAEPNLNERKGAAITLLAQLEQLMAGEVPAKAEPVMQAVREAVVPQAAASAPATREYTVPTSIGAVQMIAHASGLFTAQLGMHRCSDNSEAEAIQGVLAKQPGPRVTVAIGSDTLVPAVAAPASASPPAPINAQPAPKPATAPPPELISAQGFRDVCTWFHKHGILDADAIMMKLTEWKDV